MPSTTAQIVFREIGGEVIYEGMVDCEEAGEELRFDIPVTASRSDFAQHPLSGTYEASLNGGPYFQAGRIAIIGTTATFTIDAKALEAASD